MALTKNPEDLPTAEEVDQMASNFVHDYVFYNRGAPKSKAKIEEEQAIKDQKELIEMHK